MQKTPSKRIGVENIRFPPRNQPRNPTPRSEAHVKAEIYFTMGYQTPFWNRQCQFKRLWPPLEILIGALLYTVSVCLALEDA